MNARDRHALLLGGGVVLAAGLLLRGVPWVVNTLGSLRARAEESVAATRRAEVLLAESPATRDSLARALAAIVSLAPRLLESGTAADAGAALAGHVSLVAAQSSLRVVRIDPLPDSAGVFGRAAVRVELEGDVRGLARFLAAIERGDPLLTVPALAVSAPSPLTLPAAAEELKIEATVAGLFLRRAAK